ncbi:hypothetical protein DO97_04535 [Neosynechococcus sphagnicola sy1]|uniref:Uncharacterized protein n=1 Tax=Neosynechococcus sphagnicola sy1 TaxID=1497020 RepID=A0A098TM61_9CYAN|nr:hypothetical protein DO97_04535 [Neosynechococcus sphagnicola sy1]
MIKLTLFALKGVEECPMTAESVFIFADLIRANPLDQILQILVLFATGGKLLRFPGPRAALCYACLNPRVKKDELLTIRQYWLNNICVTAFNYPAFIICNKTLHISETVLQRASFRAALKRHFIQRQACSELLCHEFLGQGTFA